MTPNENARRGPLTDHALSELYRAADDLSPWYSAAELGEMILARARHVAYQPEESTRG